MATAQEQYDDAMYAFSTGDFEAAIAQLTALLEAAPDHFDAQLALGMAYCRKGDYARAIQEGHQAERMRPKEQLVHTNLSLFYLKAGDKEKAEHHGLQARIASWRSKEPAADQAEAEPGLAMAKPATLPPPVPSQFPDMPWKKKPTSAAQPKAPPPLPEKNPS